MTLSPQTNTSKRHARNIFFAKKAYEDAQNMLVIATQNLQDAHEAAQLQSADDWNAMNRLLRSFELDN